MSTCRFATAKPSSVKPWRRRIVDAQAPKQLVLCSEALVTCLGRVRLLAGFIVASYWTLHESAFTANVRGNFTSPPTVPDPGVEQDGRANAYPYGSFGNMAKSFQWV